MVNKENIQILINEVERPFYKYYETQSQAFGMLAGILMERGIIQPGQTAPQFDIEVKSYNWLGLPKKTTRIVKTTNYTQWILKLAKEHLL